METIQLSIPNMKSPHCMMVVTETLKSLPGATLKKIASGEAEVELSDAAKVRWCKPLKMRAIVWQTNN